MGLARRFVGALVVPLRWFMGERVNRPHSPLCGVVVTYHPDASVAGNISAMVAECGRVLVVDNGSAPAVHGWLAAIPGVELIALGENRGVAAALNMGAERAAVAGIQWIVTFDQDSRPQPGMVAALQATAARNPRVAIVGPRIVEGGLGESNYRWIWRHPRFPWLFQRTRCQGADLLSVTMVVTSGSLIELDLWRQLGGFDDGLFIDYVDIDYCLKVIRAGRTVSVSTAARLDHKLGARQSGMLLGHEFRPTHHAAFRHYYIARNRVHAWRRHARAVPHWAVFDFCFAVYNAFRVVLFEPRKGGKFKAMLLGTWDGLRGRSGPLLPARAQSFTPRAAD